MMKEPSGIYIAAEDETPMSVAKKLGYVDASALVAINKWKYKGLTKTAKLRAGTTLDLPESIEEFSLPIVCTSETRRRRSPMSKIKGREKVRLSQKTSFSDCTSPSFFSGWSIVFG